MSKHTTHIAAAGLLLASFLAGLGSASAADRDTIYPSQLLKNKPALQSQYTQLIKPIVGEYGWVRGMGTETPVTEVTVADTQYAVLSSCKPHDCASQSMVSLMQPGRKQAVGALLVNKGSSFEPTESSITWLGQPDGNQRQFMAAYLFR